MSDAPVAYVKVDRPTPLNEAEVESLGIAVLEAIQAWSDRRGFDAGPVLALDFGAGTFDVLLCVGPGEPPLTAPEPR